MDLHGVVMVTRSGTVRTERAAGVADIGSGPVTGTPCTLQTRFQLCSVSKQFAAAAALLLAEAGQLALDDPVDRWLPAGSPQWSRVTLHHLLSHTAGVPHWHQAPGLDPPEPTGIGARLAAIQQAPLRTAPGEQWHYSSPGFLLVGLIVERASGQPYANFLTERILSPAAADRYHRQWPSVRPGRQRLPRRPAGTSVGPGRDAGHRRHLVDRGRREQVHRRPARGGADRGRLAARDVRAPRPAARR
jgi:CubicO group peptidase (beta-lactamase class C family)